MCKSLFRKHEKYILEAKKNVRRQRQVSALEVKTPVQITALPITAVHQHLAAVH